MSDFDRNVAARGFGAARAAAIDAGLRHYMIRVYNYMAAGVALTGVTAWITFNAAVVTDAAGKITGLTSFGQAIVSGPLKIAWPNEVSPVIFPAASVSIAAARAAPKPRAATLRSKSDIEVPSL